MQAVGPGSLLAATAASCWASVHMDLVLCRRTVGWSVSLRPCFRDQAMSPISSPSDDLVHFWLASVCVWSVLVVTCAMEQPSIPIPYGVWCRFVVYNGWRVVPFCCGYAFVWLNKELVYGTSSPIELTCKVGEVANPLR